MLMPFCEKTLLMRLSTPGGRYQVRWDDSGGATALGQLAFFAEFLEVTGLFERWVTNCPLAYTSPNAPQTRDVLGTWLLSILGGQWRYAHITGLRGDSVAPGILGMNKILSDEGLTLEMVYGNRRGGSRGKTVKFKVKPKYRNPADPTQQWTGRGLKPRWFSAALAAGKKEKDLLIA